MSINLFYKDFYAPLLFLDGTIKFNRMVRSVYYTPIHLSLQEVGVCACNKVLIEVDDNRALIVCDPHGILGQQLRPHRIHLLLLLFLYKVIIKLQIIKLIITLCEDRRVLILHS